MSYSLIFIAFCTVPPCPEEEQNITVQNVLLGSVLWPETSAGEDVSLQCPCPRDMDLTEGVSARRTCDVSGETWRTAETSDCVAVFEICDTTMVGSQPECFFWLQCTILPILWREQYLVYSNKFLQIVIVWITTICI